MSVRMRLQPEAIGSGLTSQRVRDRLVYFTGLSADYVERSDLRILMPRFQKELLREFEAISQGDVATHNPRANSLVTCGDSSPCNWTQRIPACRAMARAVWG